MSTKNLARTIIEGGRAGYSKWRRRHSNGTVRVQVRATNHRLVAGHDWDDLALPAREKVYKSFADKLSAPTRWLGTQVGRPWALVRSELVRRFDVRTTAGRHVLFDHVLPSVESARGGGLRQAFVVNAHGILCRAPSQSWPRRPPYGWREPLPEPADALQAWLDGRRIAERAGGCYWFVKTRTDAFRQARPLTPVEATRFRALPEWFRKELDPFQPRAEPSSVRYDALRAWL